MPQVNAVELYVSSKLLVGVDTEEVQQTATSLQFTALDNGCTTMEGYTMGSYTLPSQDHAANTGEVCNFCSLLFFGCNMQFFNLGEEGFSYAFTSL